MTIETLLPPEEIPQNLKDFCDWMDTYVTQHNIKYMSEEVFEVMHAKADSLGIDLDPSGALTVRKTQ